MRKILYVSVAIMLSANIINNAECSQKPNVRKVSDDEPFVTPISPSATAVKIPWEILKQMPEDTTDLLQPFTSDKMITINKLVPLNPRQHQKLEQLRDPEVLRQVLGSQLMRQFSTIFSFFYHLIRKGITIREKQPGYTALSVVNFLEFVINQCEEEEHSKSEVKGSSKEVECEPPCKLARLEEKQNPGITAPIIQPLVMKKRIPEESVNYAGRELDDSVGPKMIFDIARSIREGRLIKLIDFSNNPGLGKRTALAICTLCTIARNNMEINLSGCFGLTQDMVTNIYQMTMFLPYKINFTWPEGINPSTDLITTTYEFINSDRTWNIRNVIACKISLSNNCNRYWKFNLYRQDEFGNWLPVFTTMVSYCQLRDEPLSNITTMLKKGDLISVTLSPVFLRLSAIRLELTPEAEMLYWISDMYYGSAVEEDRKYLQSKQSKKIPLSE